MINSCWGALMLALSYHLATHTLEFYPETLATMCQSGVGACLAFLGVIIPIPRLRLWFLTLSSLALGFLLVPTMYALWYWPGGDDGGGFGWLFYMGGASVISSIVSVLTIAIGRTDYFKDSTQIEQYRKIPWFRRNSCVILSFLFCWPLCLLILLTGEAYYIRKGQMKAYGKATRIGLCVLSVVMILAFVLYLKMLAID
jgi:hypothetical protein